MSEKVMFIRYDQNKPRILESKGRPLESYDTPEGFRVYITDNLDMVGDLCTKNASKYRLFRSKAFKVKQLKPDSSYKFEDLASWNYRKVTVDTRQVDENEERIFKTEIQWYRHDESEILEPTEASITGEKPKSEPEVYAEFRKAKARIAELEKDLSDLKAENAELEKAKAELAEENELIKAAMSATAPDTATSGTASFSKKPGRGRPKG